MFSVIKIKSIGKELGFTRWEDVELFKGIDSDGYYIDIAQAEHDYDVEVVCSNIITDDSKAKIDKLFSKYEKALKKIQRKNK